MTNQHNSTLNGNSDVAEASLATPKSLEEMTEDELAEDFLAEVYKAHGVDIRSARQQVRNETLLINPTRGEVEQLSSKHRLQPPPWPPPKGGWSSPILNAARKGPVYFPDPKAETAVAISIVNGSFDQLSPSDLILPEAFTEPHWRTIYTSAARLKRQGETVSADSVNEHIAFVGCEREIATFVGNKVTTWQYWPMLVDCDLRTGLSILRNYLQTIAEKYRNRKTREICLRAIGLEGTYISPADAHQALGELLQQANGNSPSYTFRDSEEILAMQFPAGDLLLSNGYLAKGDPTVFCGAPGIGKSRLTNQLAICCALGWPFLRPDWETNAMDAKWLFLQTENGNKRLQADLSAMLGNLTTPQRQMVKNAISWHTLETEEDGIMFLSSEHAVAGIREAIQKRKPDIVVFDPLRDFAIGDLNSDAEMGATLSVISRLTREGNPKRIPFIVHHALTGKAGIAKAVGFERSGFSRNSKVLNGWARAQVNLAPGDPDNNEVMVVSSGKANNVAEFEAFPIALDIDAGTYAPDDSFDMGAWRVRIGADSPKEAPRATIATAVKFVERVGLDGIAKAKLVKALMDEGVGKSYAYRLVELAERAKSIVRRKTDDLYVVPKPVQK